MHASKFVNRDSELSFFASELSIHRAEPRVVFLAGPSGVGKSTLTAEVISRTNSRLCAKVSDRLLPDAASYNGGGIQKIARAFDSAAQETNSTESIEDFNKTLSQLGSSSGFGRRLLDTAVSEIPIPGTMTLKALASRHLSFGKFSPSELLEVQTPEKIAYLKSYNSHLLQHDSVLLNIENFHNVDEATLEFLLDTLPKSRDSYFIFEYTTEVTSKWPVQVLRDEFQRVGCITSFKSLRRLSMEHYLQIIGDKPHLQRALLERAYYESDGNLRALVDLEVLFEDPGFPTNRSKTSSSGITSDSVVEDNVKAASKDAKQILCLLCLHPTDTSVDILRRLCRGVRSLEFIDLDLTIDELLKRHLVEVEGGIEISPAHDLVAKVVLGHDGYLKYRELAYASWVVFYEQELGNSKGQSQRDPDQTSVLLSLYLDHRDSDRLLAWFDTVLHGARTSMYHDVADKLLSAMVESLLPNAEHDPDSFERGVLLKIIETYYDIGLFDRALTILRKMRVDAPRERVLWAMLLDRLNQNHDCLEYCSDVLQSSAQNFPDQARICLKMIAMISNRTLGKYPDARDAFDGLLSRPGIQESILYGFLLRNAGLVMSVADSVSFLEDSIKFFHDRGCRMYEGQVHVSMFMQMTRLGELKKAKHHLNTAAELLADHPLERHIILSNHAVLLMYSGDTDESIEELLSQARFTVRTEFDKMVILNNTMSLKILQEDYNGAKWLCDRITHSLEKCTLTNKTVYRTIYYNCCQLYARLMDEEKSLLYHRLACEAVQDHDSYWNHRLYSKELTDESLSFLAKFPLHLSFISYWHFPLPEF